jgi:hypothetical protein
MAKSPNFIGKRVTPDSSDHPNFGEEGVVIDQKRCGLRFDNNVPCECGYDDLIVKLDSGEETRIYEPEAKLLPEPKER